jgi:hypothetical protein
MLKRKKTVKYDVSAYPMWYRSCKKMLEEKQIANEKKLTSPLGLPHGEVPALYL